MAAEHELTEKENLFLADAAELLGQRWAPEPPSPSRAEASEEDDKDLRRRQQSMSFLAWQKGQLTQQLRRRSEQTLVAAADLRELSAAVRRDAVPAAKEELELSRAEEELAAARVQCLQDIQKLWDSLDAREERLEKEAEETLAAATAARQSANALVGAEDLSRAVCEQAGDLQEESSLLVDLHEDLETRDVSLQCQEAAFACLVSSASGPARDAALASLREGIASELALALGSSRQESPASIKEAILSTILPSWSVESEGPVAPAPPRVKVDPRIFSRSAGLATRSQPRHGEEFDDSDGVEEEEDPRMIDDWDDAAANEAAVYDGLDDDFSPGEDWTGEEMLDEEEEEEEEELDHEEEFEMEGDILQSPLSAAGPADSPGSALPSDSTFIGFPVPASSSETPAMSPAAAQVNRGSFPVATTMTPQRLTFAPVAAKAQPAPFPVPVWAQTTTIRPRAQVVSQPGAASVPVQFMRLNPTRQ